MKKSLLTLLGAGLLLTSCQSDEPFAPGEGGEKQVTFTLNVPGELGTRAISGESGAQNNQNADIYYTLVLDANGDKRVLQETTKEKTVTFTTPVVLGRKYDITAYASYTNNIDAQASNIKAIPVVKSFNDETKDAYTAHVEDHDFALSALPTMQLKRPFGKLRLIATDYVETGTVKNTAIDQVTVTYDNTTVTTYDATTAFFNNVGTGISDTKEFNQYYTDNTDGMPIFADYLPANGEGQDNPITFTVTVRYAESTETYSRTFNDIPVRRNALTTLKGAFFTANSEIKVEVKDAFEGQIPGNAEEQLIIAAAMGGAYTLQGNIELSKPLNITTNMTLNLNGNTLSATNAKGVGAVIEVAEGVSAKLVGGTIKSTKENGDAAINNAGELVLENITIEGAPLADGGYSAYAVVSSGKLTIGEGVNVSADRGCLKFSGAGETVINGGTFTNKDIGSRTLTSHVVDVEDGGSHKLTINGGTFAHRHTATSGGVVICNRTTGTVYVNGGNFSGGNYYGNDNLSDYGYGGTFVVTGGTYSARPAAKYIADGYKALSADGLYYVLPETIADAATTAGVTTVTESTADVSAAIGGGDAALFMWNDVAYIAETGKVSILASEEGKTTVRGIVESTALTSATVAEGIEVVGERTFRKCANLETVTLPNTLTEIGPAVFQSCTALKNIVIPESVTVLGKGSFQECSSLESINIPTGVTRIESDCLRATGLKSVEFHAGVTYFGAQAFRDCKKLQEVVINAPEFTIEANAFGVMSGTYPGTTIYVVNAEMKAYLESTLAYKNQLNIKLISEKQ